jgi:hypothetical protein
MILLLLALADAQTGQDGRATLQSCEMTPGGWVCRYRMPPVTLLGTADSAPPLIVSRPPEAAGAPASDADRAEAARQARLIANCADASWLSLCLPGDRREARRLRDEANARAALRTKVTGLLAEDQCAEAVKTALTGGDLALAREARAFCAR